MIEWNEERLKELVRRMKLGRSPGQEKIPIHLSLYNGPSRWFTPLLTQVMYLNESEWAVLSYDETDRVSLVRYLGGLGCRTDRAWSIAAQYQQPLTLELTKTLIDAGALDEKALSVAVMHQHPLTLELA